MNAKEYLSRYWNFWPPFLFTGIRIKRTSADSREFDVKLKLRFWNANYIGTQYGGSLFSMTDPFYMIMLIRNLGPEYSVVDKAATIRYLRLGKTDVWAYFRLTQQDIDAIKHTLQSQEKMDWVRKIDIVDIKGEKIAEVEKVISIKRK